MGSPYVLAGALEFSTAATCIHVLSRLPLFPLFCISLPTSPSMAQTWKHQAGLAELGAQEEFACLGP